jgi:hypothetical protein
MQYHVGRNGQQFGQFTEEEIRQGLASGRFLTSDVAWREGMPQWKPLGEVLGNQVPAAPMAPSPMLGGHMPPPVSRPAPPASGLAVTSMISGIVSFLICGLGGLGTLLAIITGHMSLSRIKRSGGTVGGRGMALTGLILGYVSILSTAGGYAVFGLGYESYREGSQMATAILTQKTAALRAHEACQAYATANGGKYPATLEELVEKGLLKAETLEDLKNVKAPTWTGEPGFIYLGEGVDDTTPGEVPILMSRAESPGGQKLVLYHDGRVERVRP